MMKKMLSLLLLGALLLCAGCQPVEADVQKESEASKTPATVNAQNVTFTPETSAQEITEPAFKEDPLSGFPLEESLPDYEPGYIPDPEPVVPSTETE